MPSSNPFMEMKRILRPIIYEEDENVHACKQMMDENHLREIEGDNQVYMFKDFDNETWNLRVGLEFVRMTMCPFCGEKL